MREVWLAGRDKVLVTGASGFAGSAVARALIRSGDRVRALLLYPFAFAAEAMAHGTRREPFPTIDGLRMSKHRMLFRSAKAEPDLGDKAQPTPEALREVLARFCSNGQLR